MEEQVKKIMAQVFNVPEQDITDDASLDTIESWDSLRHVNMVLALEQAFGISFMADEIVNMLNYKLILLVLKEKGVGIKALGGKGKC